MNGSGIPLRQAVCAGCDVRIMTWPEAGGWRAAWRLERETTWRSVDHVADSDKEAARAAVSWAERLITSKSKPRERRPRNPASTRKMAPRVATPFKEPASDVWRRLHQHCLDAEAALARAKLGLHANAETPDESAAPRPSPEQQADTLLALECEAYEARLTMELYMAAILQHKRRKNGASAPRGA
jgi:hypothetical protein